MKKIMYMLTAVAVLCSSCLNSSNDDSVIYCTSSEFKFTPSNDIFKFADVQVGEYAVNSTIIYTLSVEAPNFADTIFATSAWDEATTGYQVHLTKKATAEIDSQATYNCGYEYYNKLGQVYYTDYRYEKLFEEGDEDSETISYADIDDFISRFNAEHQYYFRWTRNGNGTYKVYEIAN